MIHWYQFALVAGACIAAAVSWHLPRAWLWIAMGVGSFIASTAWVRYGLPYGAAFGAATNLAICFTMYALAEHRWEMRVWNCFHAMITLDILYLFGLIGSKSQFVIGLEIANWAALIVIGATGVMNGVHLGYDHHGILGRIHRTLYSARKDPPFWKVPS